MTGRSCPDFEHKPRLIGRRHFLGATLAMGAAGLFTPAVASSRSSKTYRGRSDRGAGSVRNAVSARATSSVSQWSIEDFGASRTGDSTAAIQAALDAAFDNALIVIPAGTFTYSSDLVLRGVRHVSLVGSGRDSVLRSANPNASALHVEDCTALSLRGFVLEGSGTGRLSVPAANGLNLIRVTDSRVQDVTVRGVAAAGVYVGEGGRSIVVDRSTVERSLADGFHIVAAEDVRITNCEGIGTGDDSFSSIGYEDTGTNQRISFIGCRSVDSGASGMSFEGTNDGYVGGCSVEASRVAGIRVQSAGFWKTLGCNGILVANNVLKACKTDPSVGHGSIEVAAAYGDLRNIEVRTNDIVRPLSEPLHAVGYPPYVAEVTWVGNTVDGIPIA